MKTFKMTTARKVTVGLGVLLVVVGLAIHTGLGTLSSFGWQHIAVICPLGALEVFLASKLLVPQAVIAFAVVVVGVILLGKVFCAWLCPVPPLRSFFVSRRSKNKVREELRSEEESVKSSALEAADDLSDTDVVALATARTSSGTVAALKEEACASDCKDNADCKGSSTCSSCHQRRARVDSRHLILGGALLSTAIVGFPVFCLVCPVGLTFATIIALWRFVGFNEPTLSLLVFPAILLIELVVFKKWCHKLCPLGAVLSLMSLPNRFFRPVVDRSKCIRANGGTCTICSDTCEELLDPHHVYAMNECTKCGVCKEQCPTGAIRFALFTKRSDYDVTHDVLKPAKKQ